MIKESPLIPEEDPLNPSPRYVGLGFEHLNIEKIQEQQSVVALLQTKISRLKAHKTTDNPFIFQNELMRAVCGLTKATNAALFRVTSEGPTQLGSFRRSTKGEDVIPHDDDVVINHVAKHGTPLLFREAPIVLQSAFLIKEGEKNPVDLMPQNHASADFPGYDEFSGDDRQLISPVQRQTTAAVPITIDGETSGILMAHLRDGRPSPPNQNHVGAGRNLLNTLVKLADIAKEFYIARRTIASPETSPSAVSGV